MTGMFEVLAMRLPAHAQEDRNNRIGIDAIRIEVAETHVQRMLAHDLLSQQYRKAGYLPPPFSWPCAQEITLLALHGHRAVATLTIRVDSQAAGLLADHRYGPLLNQYRADGHVLCEFIRFAIDSDAPVMQVLGKLLETGWPKAARQFGATDVFVECHPRHSAFYRRALAFKIIGSETTCERVGAPAVLLHLPVERLRSRHIADCSECVESRTRELSTHIFGLPDCTESSRFCGATA